MKRESSLRERVLTRESCEFFVADSFRVSQLAAAAAQMGGLRAGGVREGRGRNFGDSVLRALPWTHHDER